jgi:hypothetical protein
VPGRLTSNNGCGRGTIEDDAYLIAVEFGPQFFGRHRAPTLGWQFTQSAGFNSIGAFRGHKSGSTFVFRNAVGDSFKYTP